MGFDISAVQILIVLVIALLVFGPKRLPDLGKQIGKGIREIKSQVSDLTDGMHDSGSSLHDPDEPASPAMTAIVDDDDDLLDGVVVSGSDDDLLDGVVVSGSDGPSPKPS